MGINTEITKVTLESMTIHGDQHKITRITGIVIEGRARVGSLYVTFEGKLDSAFVRQFNGMIEDGAAAIWADTLAQIEQHIQGDASNEPAATEEEDQEAADRRTDGGQG